LSNIVLASFHRLTCLGRLELFTAGFAFSLKTKLKPNSRSPSNPMFGAKQLSLNRDTESVVALAPNIGQVI